jgi:hypothetical protein
MSAPVYCLVMAQIVWYTARPVEHPFPEGNYMGVLISLIIILTAAATVVGVMYMVLQEKHEHEEWFIPPEETPALPAAPAALPEETPAAQPAQQQSADA